MNFAIYYAEHIIMFIYCFTFCMHASYICAKLLMFLPLNLHIFTMLHSEMSFYHLVCSWCTRRMKWEKGNWKQIKIEWWGSTELNWMLKGHTSLAMEKIAPVVNLITKKVCAINYRKNFEHPMEKTLKVIVSLQIRRTKIWRNGAAAESERCLWFLKLLIRFKTCTF